MPRRLRIFISSPADVPGERLRADLVVDKLSQDYGRFFVLETYRWEHEPMLASGHFQDAIDPPSAADIVVLIVWSRLGTPLPEKTSVREYRGLDGRAPVTGTEWEFEDALKSARERGAPDILAFRNVSPAAIDIRSPEARADRLAQLDALDAFWRRHFADRGVFHAAYEEYHTLDEFARRLEASLRKLIERRIKAVVAGPVAETTAIWSGAPFRGLESYAFEHAAIYFGRDALVARAAEQLARQARDGTAFLVVSGPSGSGKSSLVKAALVPRLMKPQRISGAAFVRRAEFRTGDHPGDLVLGLVDALTRGSASTDMGLPELLAPGQKPSDLAAYLRSAADRPGYVFTAVLGRLTQAGRRAGRLLSHEEAKLILVVDQLEELFTVDTINAEDRRLLVRLLAGLARSGAIWVVATMRADFWHRAAEVPELLALTEGAGRIDVPPPSPAELAEMIRKPAQAAGLSFEVHSERGLGLDAVLAEHAASEPGVLPLLSFTLDALYVEDVVKAGGQVLTFATYERLGGLEGAIATRADEIVTRLPAATASALPRVLRALTAVAGPTGETAVARAAPLSLFPAGSRSRVLVDALIAGRLLVASNERTEPMVRLAHEALISHWKRAAEQLASDRRDLDTRALVERQQARWRRASGPAKRQLLLRDPDLANAVDLYRRWGDELDRELRSFIDESRQHARRRQRMAATAATVFGCLALVATAATYFAYRAQQEAVRERARAERNYASAKDTVDSLIFNITQGLRNVEGMRIETLAKVLGTVRETIDTLAAENPNDPELERSRSVMLDEFAETYLAAGDLGRARAAAEESLAIARRLHARDPGNPDRQRDVVVALIRLGDVRFRAGDAEPALQAYEEALAIARRLSELDPTNIVWRRDIGVSLSKIGDVRLRFGNAAEALTVYEEWLAILRRIAAEDPANTRALRDIGVSLNRIGGVRERAGDSAGALSAYEESLAIARRLAGREPDNTEWQRDIGASLERIGNVRFASSDSTGALKAYEEWLAIARRLATRDPDNTKWQRDAAVALVRIGELRLRGGDAMSALMAYQQGLDVARRLFDRDRENVQWHRDISVILDKIGDLKLRAGDAAGALKAFVEALDIARVLAARDPDNVQWQSDLAVGLNKVGDVKLQLGDPAGALQAYEESLAIVRRLVALDADNMDWQRDLSVGFNKVGDVRLANGDAAGALAAYEEGLAIRRRLAALDRGKTQAQIDVVISLWKIAQSKKNGGDLVSARAALTEALEILERLDGAGSLSADQRHWPQIVRNALGQIAADRPL